MVHLLMVERHGHDSAARFSRIERKETQDPYHIVNVAERAEAIELVGPRGGVAITIPVTTVPS